MKISDLIPYFYNNNVEMNNIINSEEIELENNLKTYIETAFDNNFTITANEEGVSKYEAILNIFPDKEEETLTFRKERIINRLTSQIPFTEKFLQNKLDEIIGENIWNYTINYNDYSLVINITMPGKSWFNELIELLDKIVPCNINYTVNLFAASWKQVKDNFATWNDLSDMTWEDVKEGEWIYG